MGLLKSKVRRSYCVLRIAHDARRTTHDEKGVGIVAIMLILAMLSIIGTAVTMLVATGAITKTNDLVREQAFGLVHAGFEYALMRANDGVNPNGDIRNLGNGQFTVNYANNGLVTINTTVSAMQGSASPSFSISGPAVQSMNSCLTINTAGATLTNGNMTLQGITLTNTCNAVITISGMTNTWAPDGAERLNQIIIGGTTVYNNGTGVVSGTSVALSPVANIPTCNGGSPTTFSMVFNAAMTSKNITMLFTMSDASTKSASVQTSAATLQADCLQVDTSAMAIGFTNFVRLLNGTLTNTCSSQSIRIDQLTVSWTPTSPARTMSSASIGGSVLWSGSSGSPATAALSPQVTIAASGSTTQDYLNFSDDMRGYNFSITYVMQDASTKVVTVNLYETTPAACLTVNTAAESRSGNNIIGQTWQNTCPLRIVIDLIQTSWTPTTGGRRLTSILVNGSSVWTGSSTSGTTADISNVDIPGSTTYPVTSYGFNNSMAGRCISHVITTFPSGTVSVPAVCF